jgi:hypothetical protein
MFILFASGGNNWRAEMLEGVAFYVYVGLFATLVEQQVRGEREPPHYQMNCSAAGISDR